MLCLGNLPYLNQLEIYQKSTFCLNPIGDTINSRRLYDVILNKCIPIIVGPPYHVMPIIKDWSFAIIIEIFEIFDQFNSESKHLNKIFNQMLSDNMIKPDFKILKYDELPSFIDLLNEDKIFVNNKYNKLLDVYEQLIYWLSICMLYLLENFLLFYSKQEKVKYFKYVSIYYRCIEEKNRKHSNQKENFP